MDRRYPPLTPQQIKARLRVDIDAGRAYWIDASKHHRRLNGLEAGQVRAGRGGKSYWVIKFDGVARKRSQIVFAIAHGRWAEQQVVHKNSDSLDDRADNLEEREYHGHSPKASVAPGERYGMLVTLAEVGLAADKHRLWDCLCDCGGRKVWKSNSLKSATNPSCGCVSRLPALQANTKHGQRGSPTYSSWQAAVQRCENPNAKGYARYGGSGIRVCDEWRHSFEAFYAHMGERPKGTTLDRFPDQLGSYEPGNCRWATPIEQARNRRNTLFVQWRGTRTPLAQVATELGISTSAAFMRLKRGNLHP